jgi:phosphoenolpyruvate carboxylase
MLEHAFRAQSELAFEHYLDEIHALGAELPLSRLLTRITPELDRLGALSPDRSAHREDEPYRRALTGIYARLAATATALGLRREHRRAVGDAEPYPDVASLSKDLDVIDRSLRAANGAAPRRRAAAAPAARRAHLRIPPCHRRRSPELRCPRGRRRGAAAMRGRRGGL